MAKWLAVIKENLFWMLEKRNRAFRSKSRQGDTRMVRLVILSSVLVPLLAACGEKTETEIAGEQAIEAVKRVLTDPYSAQFKVIDYRKLAANLYAICGEVNAKNRMGGYTGYKKFAVTFDGKERTVYLESDDLGRLAANLYCGEKFKHTIVR